MRGNQSIPIIPSQLQAERDVGLYDATRPVLLRESRNIVPYFNSLRSIDGLGGVTVDEPVGTLGVDPDKVKIIFSWNVQSGSTRYLAQTTTRLWKYNNGTNAWDSMLGANPALTGAAAEGVDWATWWFDNNNTDGVITCNWADDPIYWRQGDAAWTVITAATPSRTIETVADRVVIGNLRGATARPDRVRWSAFKDQDTWPALALADLNIPGDNIVSIRRISRTGAIVYKDQAQYLMQAQAGSDAAAFRFELADESPGPLAVRSVCRVGGGEHYYLGNDMNIYRFSAQRAQMVARTSYELGLPVAANYPSFDRFCHLIYLPKRQSLLCMIQPGSVSMSGFLYEIRTSRLMLLSHDDFVIVGQDTDPTRDGFIFWEGGLNKTGYSKQAAYDDKRFDDASTVDLRIMLPIQAGVEYEIEGADIWFDKITPVVASFNDFVISFYHGPDVDHLTQSKLHAAATIKLDGLSYYSGSLLEGGYAETTLRAAVVQFRLKSDNMKDVSLVIHRINLFGWARRDTS
jgi:hypothetical protein